uniref:Uncharacterized protein n=1 Tax=Pithovirus LCPAC101 TaxID=2506586 RepID=A0A481Z326_9VIRU|nr:MAG: hypothetical protein LCPAC101_01880 [Pithovirus LCPAC101]
MITTSNHKQLPIMTDFFTWYQDNKSILFALDFDGELTYIPPMCLYNIKDSVLTKSLGGDIIDGVIIKKMQNKELVLDILSLYPNVLCSSSSLIQDNIYEVLVFDDIYLNGKLLLNFEKKLEIVKIPQFLEICKFLLEMSKISKYHNDLYYTLTNIRKSTQFINNFTSSDVQWITNHKITDEGLNVLLNSTNFNLN